VFQNPNLINEDINQIINNAQDYYLKMQAAEYFRRRKKHRKRRSRTDKVDVRITGSVDPSGSGTDENTM